MYFQSKAILFKDPLIFDKRDSCIEIESYLFYCTVCHELFILILEYSIL